MTQTQEQLTAPDLVGIWPILSADERLEGFRLLDPAEAEDFFLTRAALGQSQILLGLAPGERRRWLRMLAPDDAADVLQIVPHEQHAELLALLDEPVRHEVTALLAYEEDAAGGLMSPRFVRVRSEMSVDEALAYVRRQARNRVEMLYYAYILDPAQRLLGVVSLRELFSAPSQHRVSEIMRQDVVSVAADLDQEAVARVIARHDLIAVPVVDSEGRMQGIVTVDDIVDVVNEEATEDMHKLGGMQALDVPYWQTEFFAMVRKRGGWLALLFVGETLTASAMGSYQDQIARAVVLSLFIPLIISSGGNSGSQATTLIVRAIALGEVHARDVLRVARRELASGLSLGLILAAVGLAVMLASQLLFQTYGDHATMIAATVAISLIGVVAWGNLAGSLLPFALRALGWDPASASAPFVATLVDVSGLLIYFNVAQLLLRGSLL